MPVLVGLNKFQCRVTGTPPSTVAAPGSTFTVYRTGESGPAALLDIFDDANALTPLSNPGTVDATALLEFYVDADGADVQISGAGITTPYTLGAVAQHAVLQNCVTADLPTPTADLKGVMAYPSDGANQPVYCNGVAWTPFASGLLSVLDFGAVGDGVTNDTAAFVAAMAAGVAQLTPVLVPPGEYIVNNLSIPATTGLWFIGGIVSVNVGQTITVSGVWMCPPEQCIAGLGTVNLDNAKIESAHPEWWGIDGTADEVQINKALAAARTVVMTKASYDIKAPILTRSWNNLFGRGVGATILDWTGGVVGNQDGKIEVLGCTNVRLGHFTIDGQSADATLLTGSGIVVDNSSSHVIIDDITTSDIYRHGLIINTGFDVHVSRFKVDTGCSSSAIIVGQFPAVYGLSTNQDCTDIFFHDITINNVQSDGLGIWNCSGGDGFASVCERINTDGLVVKKWGRAGLGYAYWGSGVTTYANDVNLVNFSFNNVGAGATNQGRGLHLESGTQWNHANGTMRNLITGAADIKLGYAISCAGGSDLSYTDINIYACGIGVLCNNGQNARFTNINVNYANYAGYYIGGTSLHFTNCRAFTTGAATTSDLSFLIFAQVPLTVDDVTFDNCYGYVSAPNAPATCYPFRVSATNFSNLRITNFKTDNALAISPGSFQGKLHGDSFSVALPDSVAAGTDYEVPIHIAPQNYRRIFILNAYLSFSTGIPVDAVDYNTYKLVKRDGNGINPVELTTVGIVTSTTSLATAFKPVIFAINGTDAAHIGNSESLTFKKTHAAAGKAETNGILTIEYTSW